MATSYTKLADHLAVTSTTSYSQAVSMNGANAVQVDVVYSSRTASQTVDVAVQGSNDLENWAAVTTSGGGALGLGFATPTASGIAWQYVRLSYTLSTTGTGFLSAGLSTAQLGT